MPETIASIYPGYLMPIRTRYIKEILTPNGRGVFPEAPDPERFGILILELKPASPKEPFQLTIDDGWGEKVYLEADKGEPGTLNNAEIWKPEKTIKIANAAIDTWAGGFGREDTDPRPGVWLVDKTVPFAEQVAGVAQAQMGFWSHHVRLANEKARMNKFTDITKVERMAAKELGLTPEWLTEDSDVMQQMRCPYCAQSMLSSAPVCPNCRNIVDQQKFAALQNRLAGPGAPATPPPPPSAKSAEPRLAAR